MPHRIRVVLPAVVLLALLVACSGDDAPPAAPPPAPTSSLVAGAPTDPCALDERLLAELLDDELSAGRRATEDESACEWVSTGGVGVVVSRMTVSDWLDHGQGLTAGVELDLDEACGAYRQVLKMVPEPEADHVTTSIDTVAGTRATFVEHGSGRQTLHVMTCDSGVLMSLQLTGTGISGADEDVERTLDTAEHLYDEE